jgi:hypothetical protein
MTSTQFPDLAPGAVLIRHRRCDAEEGEAEAIQGLRCCSRLTMASSLRCARN